MYKVLNGLAPTFMREIFPQRNLANIECVAGNLRNQVKFYNTTNPKSTNYGLYMLRHLGPIIWKAIPNVIRESPSLNIYLKYELKDGKLQIGLVGCVRYIYNIGYVNVSNM